jgi:hypothetical protein
MMKRIREGNYRKGGLTSTPSRPKPKFTPPAQSLRPVVKRSAHSKKDWQPFRHASFSTNPK